MPLYEIYQAGKVQPLTTVEAETYKIYNDSINNRVVFTKANKNIAQFNFNNISGFKQIEPKEQEEDDGNE